MRANRAYRLIVTRGSHAPAWLAGRDRVDHLEIVEVASGEVVLFWDRVPRDATKLARELKTDLAGLDDEEFISKWDERGDEPAPAPLEE
jgi:hypothetical protein